MPTAGIKLHPGCHQAFDDIQKNKKNKYCIFKIDKFDGEDTVIIDYQAPPSTTETEADERASYEEFMNRLINLNQPRYCLYDFRHVSDAGQKIEKSTYIYWSPDSAPSKMKMIYASTNDECKKAFHGLSKYHQCNDGDELSYKEIYDNTIKTI